MRIAVAVSGGGSNLQALLDSLPAAGPARIALVMSNTATAGGLARAEARGVTTAVFRDFRSGTEWVALLEAHGIELIVLAGYLKLVPPEVIAKYRGRILNVHPALLPSFPGTNAQRQALEYGVKVSGATVHVVETLSRWNDWEIVSSTVPAEKRDAQTASFALPVPAEGTAQVTYTVRYRWAPDVQIP